MSFTLELFEDPDADRVLSETRRVLRARGRVAIVCLAAGPKPSLASSAYAWLHRQLPHLLDCRPIPIRGLLERNGFVPYRTEALRLWGLAVAVALATPEADGRP